jgi:hypothetical protein
LDGAFTAWVPIRRAQRHRTDFIGDLSPGRTGITQRLVAA